MTANLPSSFETVLARVTQSSRCGQRDAFYELAFRSMSTDCRVNFVSKDASLAKRFQSEILQWIAWFEAHYSRFIPDSLISRINAAAGLHWVEVDPETDAIFNLCQEMVFFTKGVFDPTSMPLIRLWDWKAKPSIIPDDQKVKATLELVGWRKVQRRNGAIFLPVKGMCLDFGGIGKEYAVDRVLRLGVDCGIENLLVDFGQDVRVHGQPPERGSWYIGLEDPKQPGKCWTAVAVNNHAVATSGDYVRNFTINGRRFGHIIDPRDGYPVNNGCLSVSVIAPNCTMAGIMSTSAFVLGPKAGLQMMDLCHGVEGAITLDGSRIHTRSFYSYATK